MKKSLALAAALLAICAPLQAAPNAASGGSVIDSVSIGDQKSESDHALSGTNQSGSFNGRTYRDGADIQYTLQLHGAKSAELAITYWGGDSGRSFEIFANNTSLATEKLDNSKPDEFFEKKYQIPASVISSATNGNLVIKLETREWVVGGIYELRLVK